MSVVYSNNFDAETVGELPTNWANRAGTGWVVGTTSPVSSPNSFNSPTDGNFCDYPQAPASLADCEIGYSFKRSTSNFIPKGIACRMNGSSFSSGYLVIFSDTFKDGTDVGQVYLFTRSSGNWNAVSTGAITISGGITVDGDVIDVALKIIGTSITMRIWKHGTTKPVSGTGSYTWTNSTITGAGYPGLYAVSNALPVDDFWVDDLASTDRTVSLALVQKQQAINILATSNLSRTVSLGLIQKKQSLAIIATSAAPTGTSIPVDNENLLWAPGAWLDVAISTYGVSIHSRQTANSGAYLHFSVASATDVSLAIDPSIASSLSDSDKPSLWYSVDDGTYQIVQILAQTSIALLTGGASGLHTFKIVFVAKEKTLRFSSSAGVSFTNGVRIQGLTINQAASMVALTVQENNALFYGDSIMEGLYAGTSGANNPLNTICPIISSALSSEFGEIGFGGQGFEIAGTGVPAFPSTWNKYSVDKSRSLTGYKYVFIMHGTNDGMNSIPSGTIATDIQAWLTNARSAFGASTYLLVIIPPGGYEATGLTSGYNNYVSAYPSDSKVHLIDMRANVNVNYFNDTMGANTYSYEGVHPNLAGNQLIAAEILRQVNLFLTVMASLNLVQGKQSLNISASSDVSRIASLSIIQKKQSLAILATSDLSINISLDIIQKKQSIYILASTSKDRTAEINLVQKAQSINIQASVINQVSGYISINQKKQSILIDMRKEKVYYPGDIIKMGTEQIKLYARWRPL